ncbi:MAG: ankyrin repeat domain-containing protein [Gammaproteobacteria bacterium]|nr:ankyrin repeat domain-containing protein [Gammaproteobacteria bacterium]
MAVPNTMSRWVRPLDIEPGHWKKQLPSKYLKLAERGEINKVKNLLDEHPEFLNKRGSHGRTLLWSAVRRGRIDLTRWLLDQGADANLTGCINSESFVQLSPLSACRFYRRGSICELLKTHGAEDDLFRLTYRGDFAAVLSQIEHDPSLLHAEDPHDEIYYSPLLAFAIVGGQLEMARSFVSQGFDVSTYSFQLIYIASHFGVAEILDLLFANGAFIESADAGLWLASNDMSILHRLIEEGLSPNQRPNGDLTPLLYVCRADKGTRLDKLKLLLELGADVSATSDNGRTALHYATMSGNFEACKLLLDARVDPQMSGPNVPPAADLAEQRGFSEIAALIRSRS